MIVLISFAMLLGLLVVSAFSFGIEYTAERICTSAVFLAFPICLIAGSALIYHDEKNAVGAIAFACSACLIGFPVFAHALVERRLNFIANRDKKLRDVVTSKTGNESCGCLIIGLIFFAAIAFSFYSFIKL